MKVLIDGDGCPVVKETIKMCQQRKIEVVVFIDTAHVMNSNYAKVIMVDKGSDSVDFAMVNKVLENDIVITQDYGLASMVLAKKARAVNQNGLIFTEFNIDSLLASRHISKMARMNRSNNKVKGPKKRTKNDNDLFIVSFGKMLDSEKK